MTPNPVPAAAAQVPSPPPANKTKTVLKWVALVLGVPFALGLVLVATLVLFDKTQKKTPLTAAERGVLITAEDLVSAGAKFTPDAKHEVSGHEANIDGSDVFTYEYESKEEQVYVSCQFSIEKSEADAIAIYAAHAAGNAMDANLANSKVSLQDRDDLLAWGDQSKASVFMSNGQPQGNAFLARKKNRVFFTVILGAFLDDPEDFRSLVQPKLEAMDALPR